MRRLALVLVVALALAACGGGSHKNSDAAQIKTAYEKFFSPQTSLSDRVALLQNGPRFRTVIQGFASNPLAKNVSVTVSSVKLHGASKADVVYQVKFAGSSLPAQKGSAFRENGTWKVGSSSLCKLIALQGSAPSVCNL